MFALGVRYLNGWSMAAADGARKERAEWPPHPDRVFMALAAAWFETRDDTGEHVKEGAALRWLQGLPPPAIAASDAAYRAVVTGFVPVNDDGGGRTNNPRTRIDKLRNKGLARLPEHRLRKPRRFPVAIPRDPVVRMIWRETALNSHRAALERLAAKVTHVGHSASLVQAWVERDCDSAADWEPTEGIAVHRLRVPSPGSLDRLVEACNRDAWIDYRNLLMELERARTVLKAMRPPPRVAWRSFPDAVLLADEIRTRRHPEYAAAKAGDAAAAAELVHALVDDAGVAAVRILTEAASAGRAPVLVGAHAYERDGFNAIPAALTRLLSERLDAPCDTGVVQTNVVGHTGADGYGLLARQATFEGEVKEGRKYVIVDDFIGQGGTLANLRGWVEKRGGAVVGAVALTGKPYSARLNPSQEQLHELREKHGSRFERWWREHFGHAFDCLTQSEARYLARSPDIDTIRDRLAAAMREGGFRHRRRSPREQSRYIESLTSRLADRFPDGPPRSPARPVPGRWRGYARPQASSPGSAPRPVFDPRLIVLALGGDGVSLPATLKLTAALRGLLMRECPEQPPPEWFSGHRSAGRPATGPHLALAPLPFVGSRYADGRIMGLAVVLPHGLRPEEAAGCVEPILRDSATGLPRERRLFMGNGFERAVELETRDRPPKNLDSHTWTMPSRVWASVTPVVLNRHFDGRRKWERSAESLKEMCEHIGLPRPGEVLLHPVSRVEGAPHAREFPQLIRKRDGGRRSHCHAVVVFDAPVRGPVLIGAGRFRGYGLCRPMERGSRFAQGK